MIDFTLATRNLRNVKAASWQFVLYLFQREREVEDVDDAFGLHVTIDMYGLNKNARNRDFIDRAMNLIPAEVGMKRLLPAVTMYYNGGDKPEDRGITSFVLLAESHSSLHVFEQQDYASFDLFSCRAFDAGNLVQLVTQTFGCTKFDVGLYKRGHRYNRKSRYAAGDNQ